MVFILTLIVFVAVAAVVLVAFDIDLDEDFLEELSKYNPIFYFRRTNTPSCRTCVHGSREFTKPNHYNGTVQKSHKFLCKCPEAIDALERKDGTIYDAVLSEKVRGRMYCKYKEIDKSTQTENKSDTDNNTEEKEM